jgi:hypothetical protein
LWEEMRKKLEEKDKKRIGKVENQINGICEKQKEVEGWKDERENVKSEFEEWRRERNAREEGQTQNEEGR